MKRVFTSLLTMLLVFAVGAYADISGLPAVGDKVAALADISNAHTYTITAPRGGLSVNAAGTANVSATAGNASKEETATQWAILKGAATGDGYFLYNIAAQKFLTSGNTLSADSPDPVTLQLATNPNGDYIFKITSGANTLNNNNQGAFKLDSWSTEDDGNRLIIAEAGDFDASSLSAILNAKAYSNVEIGGLYYNLKANVNGTNTAVLSEGNKQVTLADIVVPATVTYEGTTFNVIGCQGQTFRGNTNIKTIKFESDSLDYSLGTQIFENMTSLTSVNLPPAYASTKQGLADWAFAGCTSLTNITFPEGFTTIDNATTYNNASLTSMTIPSTVTRIGYSCFAGSTFSNASGSYRVYVNALTPPTVDTGGAGYAGLKNAIVVVPNAEVKAAYEANNIWSKAKGIIVEGEKTTSITWNVVDSLGNVLATETFQDCIKDTTYTSSFASYVGVTLQTPSVKATDEDQTINTTFTFDSSALPFKLSASTDSIEGWYKVTIRGTKVLTYNDATKTISDGAAPAAVIDGNAFAFVGTPFGFNLYNYEAGLEAPFGPAQNTGVALTAGDKDAAAKLVFEHSTEAGFENYNLIRYANNSIGYLNDVNNVLSVWNSTNNRHDAGSNFAFEKINLVSLDDLNALIAASDSVAFGTNPGYYTEASATAYNTAIANAKTIAEAEAEALTELGSVHVFAVSAGYNALAAAKEALTTVPLTDGYYIVYNDNENIAKNNKTPKAMFFDASAKEVRWGAYDDNDAKFVLKVTSLDTEANTYTIQSVASGLYGGNASGFCGTVPTSTTANPLRLKLYPGTGSYIITGNLSGDVAWDYCPQGNPAGTADGPSYVWAYNGDGTGSGHRPYAEWCWRFEPYTVTAKLDTLLANSLAATINGADSLAAGEGPGTYSQEVATAYNTALATARTVSENGTIEDKVAALKAYNEAVANVQPTPITEGYYFITSAGNGPGYSGGPYNYEDKNALYNDGGIVKWKAYSREDKTEVYKFTKNADGNWDVYSLADSTYINKGTGSYACDVTTTATPTTSQKFTLLGNGNGKFAMYSAANVYGLYNGHNGSAAAEGKVGVWGNVAEARNYGVNQWFLRPISEKDAKALFFVPDALDSLVESLADAYNTLEGSKKVGDYKKANVDSFKVVYADAAAKAAVDTLTQEERNAIVESLNAAYELAISERNTHSDYFDIALTPSVPEVGKTYVIKNTGNGTFLSTKGGTVKNVNTIDNSEIWTIALSGDSVDGAATYYLKSATKADTASYFQYVDYGSQTWDETTPYDGYDWYNYAGFNGSFGADTTAQAFTILPATAYATPDTRSTVGENKTDSGFVFTAAKQIMGKYYKLDIQGSDAALDPYNNQVAWLFLEATAIEDADSALQLAINKYSGKEMIGGTAPGYYAASAVEQYNGIIADAEAAQTGTDADKRASVQALLSIDTLTFEVNPIAEGYYYIVSAGNGPGYSGGPYDNENKFALYNNNGKLSFAAYDANDTKYVYQISGTGDTLMVKNIQDNSYIASYAGTYGCDVLTSDGAATAQVFTWEKEGKFAVNAAGKQYVWATAGNHNGTTEASGNISVWGTPGEAGNYGVNLWYLIPCSEDMIQKITGIDGVAQSGNDASVVAGDGKVTVSSDKAQTIVVVSTSGAVVARQQVAAGETTSIHLVPGVYIVNGKKVAVK